MRVSRSVWVQMAERLFSSAVTLSEKITGYRQFWTLNFLFYITQVDVSQHLASNWRFTRPCRCSGPYDPKAKLLYLQFFPRKGVSLGYVGRIWNLKDLKDLRRPNGRDVWVLRWFSGFNHRKSQLWTIAPLFYFTKVNMGSNLAENFNFSSLHIRSGPWKSKRQRFLSLFGIFRNKSPKMNIRSLIHQVLSGNQSSWVEARSEFNWVDLKTP